MKLVSLISGGIDSPVASYMMSEAGADVVLLHMDNGAYGDPREREKVLSLSERLEAETGRGFPVYVADHGPNQDAIMEAADRSYQCVMCKRVMHSVAARFAKKIGASGVVMGDSMGQVASQTLTNIRAEQQGLDVPILRPLIGLDKTEIIAIAERIGTYPISIVRTSGCAAVPQRPITEAKPDKVLEFSGRLDLDALVGRCLSTVRRVRRWPGTRAFWRGRRSWPSEGACVCRRGSRCPAGYPARPRARGRGSAPSRSPSAGSPSRSPCRTTPGSSSCASRSPGCP